MRIHKTGTKAPSDKEAEGDYMLPVVNHTLSLSLTSTTRAKMAPFKQGEVPH